MKKKQQIVHIGGGEAFNSHEQYLSYLLKIPLWHMEDGEFDPWYKNYNLYLNTEIYKILAIPMPAKENACYEAWKIWFERHFEYLEDNVVLVGHSLGGGIFSKIFI